MFDDSDNCDAYFQLMHALGFVWVSSLKHSAREISI